jgi:hypothetical protein
MVQFRLVVSMMIFVLIVLQISSVPSIFKTLLVSFFAPLIASMACRVFRNVKLFDNSEILLPYPVSEIRFV